MKKIKDSADWVEAGGTKQGLEKLVSSTPNWEPPSAGEVLDAIVAFIRRYVVLSLDQVEIIALWILHTHTIKAVDVTPYLNIKSSEKRCGKTLLLEILEMLVIRAWLTGRVTAAVLARKVDAECPTLLLDESDAAFGSDQEYVSTLRGILNTGYRRGGKSSVCVGQGANIGYLDLSTFGPKAIAGIGKLPDTVDDRCIPITLKRRAPDEKVERFRRRKVQPEAKNLYARITALATLIEMSLEGAEPVIPESLNDRAADCVEPLLAIADIAGGDWPNKARNAAILLMSDEENQDESQGIRLLADIRQIFGKELVQITSDGLVSKLIIMEESPWGDMKGKPITKTKLASLLRPFVIRPGTIRIGVTTLKGYKKEDFKDAWKRYLPNLTVPPDKPEDPPATPPQPGTNHAQAETSNKPPQDKMPDMGEGSVPLPEDNDTVPAATSTENDWEAF